MIISLAGLPFQEKIMEELQKLQELNQTKNQNIKIKKET